MPEPHLYRDGISVTYSNEFPAMSAIIAGHGEINAEGRAGMEDKYLELAKSTEEEFIALIIERIQSRNFTHKDFAHAVWPEDSESTAKGRWRDMRDRRWRTGKRMPVSIENATRMASFFEEDVIYLLCLAKERALQKYFTTKNEGGDSEDS